MERHVLVVFPHPDDEAFAAGGTIRLLTDQGVPVTYACGTLGQMGRNMGKNVFANRETIPNIREKELKDACEAMGIQDLRMLGFHDKTLEFEDVDFVADKIEAIIQEVNPSRIITFYPEHGVHQIMMHLDALPFALYHVCQKKNVQSFMQLQLRKIVKLYSVSPML